MRYLILTILPKLWDNTITHDGRNGYSVGDQMAKQQHHQMQQQSRHQQTSVSIDQFPSPEQEQQQQVSVTGVTDGVIKKSSLKKKKPTVTGSDSIGTMSKQESKVSVNAAEAQDNVAGGGGGGKREKRARRRRRQVQKWMPKCSAVHDY